VNNKIISLDLAVKDVYQRVWLQDAQEGEPMRIIYRMRGLLGDATEEFIENLASKENDDQVIIQLTSHSTRINLQKFRDIFAQK